MFQNVAQCNAASAKYALDTANKFISLGLKDLGYECKSAAQKNDLQGCSAWI